MKNSLIIIFIVFLGFVLVCSFNSSDTDVLSKDLKEEPVAKMEQELEDLRRDLKIPGMSVAIAREDTLIWSKGFGWADKELQIPATEKSLFHLASLTKPYATTIVLQLVQEGKLTLDSPVSDFGVEFDNNPLITVRNLLSHTSSGNPGSVFKYDGRRFGQLEKVIEVVTGNTFATELRNRILEPLTLNQTVPNPLDSKSFQEAGTEFSLVEKYFVTEYARKWGRVLWPSGLFGPLKPIDYPDYFGTAAGLVATASDVAKFSAALDNGLLLERSMYNTTLTPIESPTGEIFPFGLGWFLETYDGYLIAWQYGHWFGSSSLIIKVPDQKVTLVVLANSDGLSRWTNIGSKATIHASPVAPVLLEKLLSKDLLFLQNP